MSTDPETTPTAAERRRRALERWRNEGGKFLRRSLRSGTPSQDEVNKAPDPTNRGIIRMHLRRLEQLFDSLDHSPFREKDLDRNAEDYIVDSIKELPSKTLCRIIIYLDEPIADEGEKSAIAEAIHIHFSRRSRISRQDLRQLLRRGTISLAIGLAFLGSFFFLGQMIQQVMGDGQWTFLLRESLLIGGWVAMWKPLEIFLYDWWPIVGERRLYDRLSRTRVEILQADQSQSQSQPCPRP